MTTDTLLAETIVTLEADLDRRVLAIHRHHDTRLRPFLDELERFCEDLIQSDESQDAERLRRQLRGLLARHEEALDGAIRLVDGFAGFDVLDVVRAARVDLTLR